jgi:hypothetical protein
MNKTKPNLLSIIALLLLMSCSNKNIDTIPTINIEKKYKSKIIKLQDIGEVKYIPLETVEGKPFHGRISAVTKNKIILTSYNSGEIFIYSRTGKYLSSFNRNGKGPEEYGKYMRVSFDSKKNEIFVQDNMTKEFKIYDLKGNFKRKFKRPDEIYYGNPVYLEDKLIVSQESRGKNLEYNYVSISKQDGSVIEKVGPKVGERIETTVMEKSGKMVTVWGFPYNRFLLSGKGTYLNLVSKDTIFKYENGSIKPVLIRTPAVASQKPYKPLFVYAESKDYLFAKRAIVDKKEFMKKNQGMVNFTYDKKNKEIIQAILQNSDYKKNENFKLGKMTEAGVYAELIPAVKLLEAFEENQVIGKLKKLASKLDENDNPVIMLTKMN